MKDFADLLAQTLGIAGPALLALVIIGSVVVLAVKIGLDHFGKREIESIRTAGAVELEALRKATSFELEKLRTELTLPAEVRKQAAGKKVAILLRLADEGAPLIRDALNAVSPGDKHNLNLRLYQFLESVRNHEYLFSDELRAELFKHWESAELLRSKMEMKADVEMRDVTQTIRRFHDLIRSELGLHTGAVEQTTTGANQ